MRKFAEDVTFGVEIECTLPVNGPAAGLVNIGGYHSGLSVRQLPVQNPGQLWTAQHDGSIIAGRNRYAVEFVSPVLKGLDGLRNLVAVIRQLKAWGAKVNASCGMHVHLGWTSNKISDLQKVAAYTAQYQDAFYAASGSRRRQNGTYCKSIKGYENLDWKAAKLERRRLSLRGDGAQDRYTLLNLTNLLSGYRPTIEYRVFSGTLNEVKAVSYVRMALAAFENAQNYGRIPKWNVKDRANGREAVRKMFWSFGWGRVTKTGDATAWNASEMTGDGLPTIEQTMQELFRLACKYDGVAVEAIEAEADTLPAPATDLERARMNSGRYGNLPTPPNPA